MRVVLNIGYITNLPIPYFLVYGVTPSCKKYGFRNKGKFVFGKLNVWTGNFSKILEKIEQRDCEVVVDFSKIRKQVKRLSQ